jgi:hypothetical protein
MSCHTLPRLALIGLVWICVGASLTGCAGGDATSTQVSAAAVGDVDVAGTDYTGVIDDPGHSAY